MKLTKNIHDDFKLKKNKFGLPVYIKIFQRFNKLQVTSSLFWWSSLVEDKTFARKIHSGKPCFC